MSGWSEVQIGIVYFSGLSIALISSVLIVLYLRPSKNIINRIIGKTNKLWSKGFKTSIVFSGLLGAMSVSFSNCSGGYNHLLESEGETYLKGFEQISESFAYISVILSLWLIIFIILRRSQIKEVAKSTD